jgi:alpha-L-arabinofuranosidase
MKRLLILLATISLVGCATSVPVQRNFPSVPADLLTACPELQETAPTTKLSEVIEVVVANYGQYQECSIKVDAWTEWYKTQRKIFEEVK